MNKLRNYLFVTGSLVLLGCFGMASSLRSNAKASGEAPTDVNVVNEPSINIANQPTVQLAQGATVQVGNLASTLLTIRNRNIAINRTLNIAQGNQTIFAVPPGKRFIIEYASSTTRRDTPSVSIIATAGNQAVSFPIGGSQVVKIYADPNTVIVISAPCVNPCVIFGATVSISGHLEDLQ